MKLSKKCTILFTSALMIITIFTGTISANAQNREYKNDNSNILINYSTSFSEEFKDSNFECYNKINKTIYNYSNLKYTMLAELEYSERFDEHLCNNCEESDIIKIIIEHRKMQITDLRFDKNDIYINIEVNNIFNDEKNKQIVINYLEHVKYKLNIEKDNIYSEELTEHIMILNHDFKIVKDNYQNDFKEEFESLRRNGKTIATSSQIILLNSQKRVSQIKENMNYNSTLFNYADKKILETRMPIVSYSTSFSKHSYNRDKAQTYALKYALSPNPNYMNMESSGGNCTNFTSQCLKAGGINHDYTGSYVWYYDGPSSSQRTSSWSYANDFRTYYKNNVGSSSVKGLKANTCTFKQTRKGDLIQKVVNGKAIHTMFIDGYICDKWGMNDPWNYKYDVYICQNSTTVSGRQKHIPFSSKNIPAEQVEYIHIDSCYY